MNLLVRPSTAEIIYNITSREPNSLDNINGNLIAKMFNLRLNDIRVNQNLPSDNLFNFSKFDNQTWIEASIGLEEATILVRHPKDVDDVRNHFSKVIRFFENLPTDRQKFTFKFQYEVLKGDSAAYLSFLNANIPSGFQDKIDGRGVSYTLRIPKFDLTIYIALASSIFIKGGIYLSIENIYYPSILTFEEAFKLTHDNSMFILRELGISGE